MKRRPTTVREWVVILFAAAGLGMIPWTIWLAASLNPDHRTGNWDVAWSVFDFALAFMFCATAVSAWRRSPAVGVFAGATGTLLVTDAWFDVILESHADELRFSIFLAVVAELPAALVCFWIAYRTEKFLARVVEQAFGRGASHLATARERPAEGDLVRVFEVAADGEPAREARDPDPPT
jgi:hypothetical protein